MQKGLPKSHFAILPWAKSNATISVFVSSCLRAWLYLLQRNPVLLKGMALPAAKKPRLA
jgi:hypothetical protein